MILELFLEDLSLWGCVWQSTLFAAVGLAGSFLLRRRPARASQVLFLTITAAVLLPVMSVLVRHFELGLFTEEPVTLSSFEIELPAEAPRFLYAPEIQPALHQSGTGPAVLNVPTEPALVLIGSDFRIPWRSIALYVWMIVTLILLGRLFVAFISGIRLLRRAKSDRCEHVRRAADAARARLGITKCLKVRSSRQVRSPMIWCWSRPPVLLVPSDSDGRVDWADVICHELAHWKRWDHISGLIAELATCILPWNPLLWWSKKRMVRLSEQACDDWVLVGGCAGADYAQSLLNLSPELRMAFIPTIVGKEKPMKKRIYRIVKEKCGIPQVGARWALIVSIVAAGATVGVALAQRRPARLEPPRPEQWPAAEEQERRVINERMTDLKNQARELKARMDKVRAELAKLEDSDKGESDEARAHRAEMRELEEAMANLERELQELEGNRSQREMRPGAGREPLHEILRRLNELGGETEMVLQRLAEQNIGRNDETNMLYNRMRELNEQMQQVRQQLGRQLAGPGRLEPEFDFERIRDRYTREFRREVPEEKILHIEELREKARQIELDLEELGGRNPERAERLYAELREIHDTIARIERELGSSRERGAMREVNQRELQEQAQMLERRVQELGDGHPQEAQELRMRLDQIHEQMERIESEPGIPERPWPRVDEPMQHNIDLHVRREHLRVQLGMVERILAELNEQGKAESEEAQMRRQQLRELQEQLQATENKLREREPDRAREPGREDLEREVQDLRKQMDNVNEQMGEMRELMKRLLEQRESPEASQ